MLVVFTNDKEAIIETVIENAIWRLMFFGLNVEGEKTILHQGPRFRFGIVPVLGVHEALGGAPAGVVGVQHALARPRRPIGAQWRLQIICRLIIKHPKSNAKKCQLFMKSATHFNSWSLSTLIGWNP